MAVIELFELFLSFIIVGLFAFGGGTASIALIQHEVVTKHGWLTLSRMVDIVALAEMTPGPIAINAATYTGYIVQGLLGAVTATVAVVLPSLIIMGAVIAVLNRFYESPHVAKLRHAIQAGVLALIVLAILSIGQAAVTNIVTLSMAIGAFTLLLILREKLHPILLIVVFGLIGLLLF